MSCGGSGGVMALSELELNVFSDNGVPAASL